ncbi:DUF4381 domain-containing protein [Granulosicoccus antarcticus]|uniref:DUF4381 domain-containing protein n=1 Tax=Granulosicoccus antarcticus IMCC3135 TaxID=1192854 RepID=A0A2Z2P4S1_9GAMM|nr:DUF4381 domain-containing protein [Granulosicoccus antarcticus]ASJ75677.1 hypothetical protein IMCC3135_28125 [Granulosicoccus antarcticus IMCC3135]
MSTQPPVAVPVDISAQLAALHDIHLPDPVAMWPPAPGWWILMLLAIVLIASAALLRHYRRHSIKLAALRELSILEQSLDDENNVQSLATSVGVLIRRVVLNLPDGKRYANVHGQQWSDYLATVPKGMPASVATLLAAAPYAQPNTMQASGAAGQNIIEPVPSSAIIAEARTWIRRHA